MKKRYSGIAVLLLCVSLVLNGCSILGKDFVFTFHLGSRDVFSIGGTSCSVAEAKVFLCNYQNLYGEIYGQSLWEDESVAEDLETYVKDVTIEQLAQMVSMDLLAEEQGISLTEDELSLVEQAAEEYYNSLTDEEISYMGIRLSHIEGLYEKYALAEKLYETLTADIETEISEDEARVVEVLQIYVTDSSKAAAVQAGIESDTDFSTLAAQYNTAENIDITVKRGDYDEAIEEAIFALDDEEITDCIETDDGYYFFKCLDKNVEDLTAENKELIEQQQLKEAFNDVYDEYLSGLSSSYNQRLWDKVEMDTSGTITTNSFFSVYESYF